MTQKPPDRANASPKPINDFAARLEAAFVRIHRERMAGLPILNPWLRVAVLGGRVWGNHWVGLLVTPWCMNLIALPLGPHGLERRGEDKLSLELPAGRLAFSVSAEPSLGTYGSYSLYSPMGEFPDQEAALATARATLDALFDAPAGTTQRFTSAPRGPGMSRRDLLRGSFG